jgi:hypothetical protein
MRVRHLVVLVTAVMLVVAPAATVASPGTYTLSTPVLASSASPFAACTVGDAPGADPPSVVYPHTEVEPQVAVNPTNPDNIIGNYQQDRWSDGGARGLVASRSFDGGVTWAQNWAEFSICSDGAPPASPFNRATDPWVSFDSAGRAYQISLGIDSLTLNMSGVEVSTSTDGGTTWSQPARLILDNNPINFNDKESITADWRPGTGAGKAYATWIRGDLPGWPNISPQGQLRSFAYRGLPMFSQTADGGQTWSTPISMVNSNIFTQGNQIAVLPDGTLVNITAVLFKGSGIQPHGQHQEWAALVSNNGGKTWGAPIRIAPLRTALLTNPDIPNPTSFDQTVRADDYLPDVAVDHTTGAIYVVFADDPELDGWNHVMLTKSTNGGKSWTTPVRVDVGTPANTHSFNGTVEVTADGTVAVMYYDFRSNTPDPGLPTEVFLAHSHDGGVTWTEQKVDGPFDMENAPIARGWFLGDYMGMAAAGADFNDLILFYSVSTAADNTADVMAVRATTP